MIIQQVIVFDEKRAVIGHLCGTMNITASTIKSMKSRFDSDSFMIYGKTIMIIGNESSVTVAKIMFDKLTEK